MGVTRAGPGLEDGAVGARAVGCRLPPRAGQLAVMGLPRPLSPDAAYTWCLDTYKSATNSSGKKLRFGLRLRFACKKSVFTIYYTDRHKYVFFALLRL